MSSVGFQKPEAFGSTFDPVTITTTYTREAGLTDQNKYLVPGTRYQSRYRLPGATYLVRTINPNRMCIMNNT